MATFAWPRQRAGPHAPRRFTRQRLRGTLVHSGPKAHRCQQQGKGTSATAAAQRVCTSTWFTRASSCNFPKFTKRFSSIRHSNVLTDSRFVVLRNERGQAGGTAERGGSAREWGGAVNQRGAVQAPFSGPLQTSTAAHCSVHWGALRGRRYITHFISMDTIPLTTPRLMGGAIKNQTAALSRL